MKERKSMLLPFNLQFFADGDDSNDGGDNQNDNGNENGNENNGAGNQNDNNAEKKEKTFSQEEVSRMMTREKQQGKQSVLNALGFKTEADAKSAFNLLKALQDSQKSEQEKAEEKKNTAIQEKAEAEKRAELAEAKLSCVMNGVDKDSVEDVLTIALAKVTDDKTLDDVIGEMKTQAKYASFFTKQQDGDGGNGTGKPPKNNNEGGSGNGADYGKSIAEKYGAKTGTNAPKSKFF